MNKDLWTLVQDRIRHKVSPQSFNTWFKPTRLVSRDAGKLSVGVPHLLFAEWLRNNYLGLIAESVREVDGRNWEIVFTCPQAQPTTGMAVPALPAQLEPRYTFDTFVVGSANQFAHAAAVAVAEQPSHAYNP